MKWPALMIAALMVACGPAQNGGMEAAEVRFIRTEVLGTAEALPPIDGTSARNREILAARIDQFGITARELDGGPSARLEMLRERIDEFEVRPRLEE